jgi:hypothetical protein
VIVLSALFASVTVPATYAQNTESPSRKENSHLAEKLGFLERSVKEVRRDQLNYKIERDLLKETNSSNIQTINIVIAIVLSIFSVLGFLGV